ncbi:hypothetical protein CK203_076948 [Vitis vinifera]|uniref:Uncharacterized protein n=1 Tax=Vitis vinifera TaxID=29760 RepID=A0A438DZM9_VITVI|nr:hypothetical protein CK203_076948 [Vitis vinifera]
MAIMRARRHLTSSSLAPPPSPIPTAKGSRSAAVDDQILSEYLHKSLRIPDLTLPESHFAASTHRSIPEDIDYGSVNTRDGDSIRRLLRSAKACGVFRINGLGVSADELQSIVAEAESVFQVSEEVRTKFGRNYDEVTGNKEEFVWLRSEEEMVEWAEEGIGCEIYQSFSKKMERIASKLHELGEELGLVFSENRGWRAQRRIGETEPVLSLYRYNHDSLMDDISPLPSERNSESGYHALTLHLPIQHCEFRIQSHQGPLSFHASPGSIVATIGEQLEEWSQGEFKSVSGEFIFDSELHGRQASLSIVLKCSPLNLNHGHNKINKVISIVDQFLIAFIFIILYKVVMFLFS